MARQEKAPRPAEALLTLRAGDIVQPGLPNRLEFQGTKGQVLVIAESGGERLAEITPAHVADTGLMIRLARALELGVLVKV